MRFPLNIRRCVIAALLACTSTSFAIAGEDLRFSKTLAVAELAATGIERLSADQLAILDALARRDIAQARWVTKQPRPPRFSERLLPDERCNAGLELLSATELTQLDAAVQRLITPPAPAFSTAGSAGTGLAGTVRSVKLRRDPEIHGSLSLLMAVGSHDYSAYGAGVVLTYDDPANNFALSVAYSEIHSKGGYYRRGYHPDDYYFGRPYRRAFDREW